jgi:adenylate cyclase
MLPNCQFANKFLFFYKYLAVRQRDYLVDMSEKSRVPITVSLFTVTLGVALTLAATIISYTHYSNRNAALTAGRELMKRSAEVVRLQTASLIAPIDSIAQYSGDWLDVNSVPKASGHPSRKRLISFVSVMPQIANIYISYEDGSNYLIGAARTRPESRLKEMGAPEGTEILEQIIMRGDREKPLRIQRFLDENGDTLLTQSGYKSKYDPRERPWYKLAQEAPGVVRTDVYLFAGSGEPGLTVSKRHANGVVGVDLTLEDIDLFLNSEPQAEQGVLAIIGDDGTLLARSSTVAASEWIERQAVLDVLQKQVIESSHDRTTEITVNGRTWITHLSPIALGAGKEENLAIALPLSEVVGPITRASHQTIVVSILIALCSVPIVWLISRTLSRPLKVLANESNRIKNFQLDDPFVRSSKVDEIFKLEIAMDQMRRSLRTFGQYVPKALVRQMIEREEKPELGGKNRDVTVLFMDLENFTSMSSHLEPEEVMRRMSSYFEIVTQTLLAHEATIDKFIGDAVMAFWNAPNDIAEHPRKACEAALAVIKATKAETDSWHEEGGVSIRTRIGIHAGNAIIGNVGSSDRLNYTALGNTVNLASRLEGLNRELKTSILISADLAERVEGKFATKPAGETRIKGYDDPVMVFELLGPAGKVPAETK